MLPFEILTIHLGDSYPIWRGLIFASALSSSATCYLLGITVNFKSFQCITGWVMRHNPILAILFVFNFFSCFFPFSIWIITAKHPNSWKIPLIGRDGFRHVYFFCCYCCNFFPEVCYSAAMEFHDSACSVKGCYIG